MSTITYELPIGKGKKYMSSGRVKNAVFGGWELMFGQTFQTGPPFTVGFAGSPNLYLPGSNRPTQIAPNDQVKLAHVDIGPNRFPFSAAKALSRYQWFPLP